MSDPHALHNQYKEQHSEHKEDEHSHLLHYVHVTHLTAEGFEFVAHRLHLAEEYREKVEAAAHFVKAHAQMGNDVRRIERTIVDLENFWKGPALFGSQRATGPILSLYKARAALVVARNEFNAEKAAAHAAKEVLHEFRLITSRADEALRTTVRSRATLGASTVRLGQGAHRLEQFSTVKLGQAAAKLEAVLGASRIGSKLITLGRLTASKPFVRALIVVGAACEAVESYTDSPAVTRGGKAANAVLGAATTVALMSHPIVAGVDALAPTGYKLSEVYHGGAAAVTAIGEGTLRNDSKPMNTYHRRSMEGHHGKILQATSEAGEYWADRGVGGTLKQFSDSIKWWVCS